MTPRVTLFQSTVFAAFDEAALRPWLDRIAENAWKVSRPSAVLVPSRSHAFLLKSRVLEHGMDVAGIHFWTPSEARSFLLNRLLDAPAIAIRESLHLLLAAAAEQEKDSAVAVSIARDPSALMRSLDLLLEGGWDLTDLGGAGVLPIVKRFSRFLKQSNLHTLQQADRWLLEQLQAGDPLLESVLLFGFDARHWPLVNFLLALTHASVESTVVLASPRARAESLDQAWVGWWEERAGEATPAVEGNPAPLPFAAVAESMETTDRDTPPVTSTAAPVVFLIGRGLREEAAAVAAQALFFLSDPRCQRLGILCPPASALAREISARLHELEIPHNDAPGHPSPIHPRHECWLAWLDLQERPRPATFRRFLDLCPEARARLDLTREEIRRALHDALVGLQVDDLRVLAAHLSTSEHEPRRRLGQGILALPWLPEEATLAQFLDAMQRSLEDPGLDGFWKWARPRAAPMLRPLEAPLPRATFLRWLREITAEPDITRDDSGNHPLSRVHLLPYDQAEHQSWSHLILAGLNEGGWPPPFEDSGFLSSNRIAEINRGVMKQGPQGAGHLTVRRGHAICLGAMERRALAQRQFFNLIESATVGLAATASSRDEANPDREVTPGEYLSRLHLAARGEPLTDARVAEIETQTAEWLRASFPMSKPPDPTAAVLQTRVAFGARRDDTRPFGEYEFARTGRPAKPLTLPCKEWEKALQQPAVVWMKRVLGVEHDDPSGTDDTWPLTRGTWIHDWLGSREPGFAKRDDRRAIFAAMESRSEATLGSAIAAFEKAGRPMPRWWRGTWEGIRWSAIQLARALAAIEDRPFLASEWEIPGDLTLPLDEGRALRLRGRVDVILATAPPDPGGRFSEADGLWILDFKTGKARTLKEAGLRKGTGVQVALYALALRELGVKDVAVSLLHPGETAEIHLRLEDILELGEMWNGLVKMQDKAVFGMLEGLREEHGIVPTLPLATLEVDQEILKAKWRRTHPGLEEVA